jgi:large subunit ribosomal protein L25
MKLQTIQRTASKKSEANQLRRENFIPAVLYVKGKAGETLAVNQAEFNAYLRHIKPGHLPTTVFTLVDKNGTERRVLVKEIQYTVTNYAIRHLDFEELLDDVKVSVKIPIECTGLADCVGVKLGGVLRQVIRHLRIECFPPHLPTAFQLDIRELGLKQSKRLSDLDIPDTVRPLMNLNEVVAVIVKR